MVGYLWLSVWLLNKTLSSVYRYWIWHTDMLHRLCFPFFFPSLNQKERGDARPRPILFLHVLGLISEGVDTNVLKWPGRSSQWADIDIICQEWYSQTQKKERKKERKKKRKENGSEGGSWVLFLFPPWVVMTTFPITGLGNYLCTYQLAHLQGNDGHSWRVDEKHEYVQESKPQFQMYGISFPFVFLWERIFWEYLWYQPSYTTRHIYIPNPPQNLKIQVGTRGLFTPPYLIPYNIQSPKWKRINLSLP